MECFGSGNPDDQENTPKPKVRPFAEEDMIGKAAPDMVDGRKIYRMRLRLTSS